jgi:hypothetical protein
VQVFIALRPAAIMADPEGAYLLATHGEGDAEKVQMLGPLGEFAQAEVTRLCGGLAWSDLEHVLIGIIPKPGSASQVAVVARTVKPVSLDSLTKAPGLEYRTPADAQNIFVAAPGKSAADAAVEAQDAGAKAAGTLIDEAMGNDKGPVLSVAAMEALQRVSDGQRMFTVLFAPSFMFSGDDFPIWKGLAEPLKEPVATFLGDPNQLHACLFSIHLSDNLVCLELRAQPNAELETSRLAADLNQRISELPDVVQKHVPGWLKKSADFSQTVLFAMPGMVKEIPAYTTVGTSGRHAVVRCYLPARALSNLSFATLLVAAQASGGGGATVIAKTKEDEPKTAAEKLSRKKTSVKDNDEFQRIVKTMSDEIRVPIEIIGPDLQNDGITRNKRVMVDLQDVPVGEALRKIFLMVDPEGKLVYFIKKDGDQEKIYISTRKRTAERKDPLPPEFAEAPKKKS